MAILRRDEILAAPELRREMINVAEWGGEVIVQEFSAAARDRFEMLVVQGRGGTMGVNLANFRAKLVAATVVDEQGNLLFTEADVEELGKLSSRAMDKVVEAAKKVNALQPGDVEELVKN